jgi:hypothetical protein
VRSEIAPFQQDHHRRCDAMTPEEALNNILKLVEGSDELEDARAMQILLQSIKTFVIRLAF